MQFTPYLLDPSTPPEGKPRRQMTRPGDPPSAMEQRAAALGIAFTRGRTWTSNSHLALEAAEFAAEHGDTNTFHRRVFKAYFEELADIGDIDMLVRLGAECGLPAGDLREALTGGRYRAGVDEELAWAQQVGVTAVPTFVLDGKLAIVGAQEASVFDEVLRTRLGRTPKATGEG